MSTLGLLDPRAAVLRRFAVDLLTAHRTDVLPTLMADDYCLNIGGYAIAGRDTAYAPAMAQTFQQFPGLCVTVHDVVLGEQMVALRFTEHGASQRDAGRFAAWQGIALFEIVDGRLQIGWAEEDYFSRKRQLRSGIADAIEAPHVAPWDCRAALRNASAELLTRRWLERETAHVPWLNVAGVHVNALFSAGDRVAYHCTYRGEFTGGLEASDETFAGAHVSLNAAGIVDLRGDTVVAKSVVCDRLGLQRSLRPRNQ